MSTITLCNHCGKTFGDKWFQFHKEKNTTDNTKLFEKLKINSLCCRVSILTSIPDQGLIEDMLKVK